MNVENQMVLTIIIMIITALIGTVTVLIGFGVKMMLSQLTEVKKTAARAHSRLDEHIQNNNDEFRQIREDFVSEEHCHTKMSAIT